MTSLIQRLLACCSPAAIVFCVVAINVNASAFWTNAHVCKEVFESQPSFAHFDSPASIQVELGIVRISAPLLHSFPASISSCSSLSGHSVGHHSFRANLSAETPTASSFFVSQFTEIYDNGGPAVALANPKSLSRYDRVKLACNKFSESHSSCINPVVPTAWNTTARLRSISSERIGRNCCFVSAFALAQPSSSSRRIVFGSLDNSKPIKCFSSKVIKFTHSNVSFCVILSKTEAIRKASSDVEEAVNAEAT